MIDVALLYTNYETLLESDSDGSGFVAGKTEGYGRLFEDHGNEPFPFSELERAALESGDVITGAWIRNKSPDKPYEPGNLSGLSDLKRLRVLEVYGRLAGRLTLDNEEIEKLAYDRHSKIDLRRSPHMMSVKAGETPHARIDRLSEAFNDERLKEWAGIFKSRHDLHEWAVYGGIIGNRKGNHSEYEKRMLGLRAPQVP